MAATRGVTKVIILIVIAVFIGIGAYLYFKPIVPSDTSLTDLNQGERDTTAEQDESPADKSAQTDLHFTGTLLGGALTGSPLFDFRKSDYEEALQSDRLVVLYFYANWCPICKAEFPKMEAAFDSLPEGAIGFRVNYNDTETDSDEEALARQFGIAYQHTKVFLKNGERILKAPDSWSQDRYISEITSRI